MARISAPGSKTSSRPAVKRVSAPKKPTGNPNAQGAQQYEKAKIGSLERQQAETRNALGGAIPAPRVPYADWLNNLRSTASQAAQAGQYPTVGRTGFNPQMSRSGVSGYNTNMLMGNQLRGPTGIPSGPRAPYGYAPTVPGPTMSGVRQNDQTSRYGQYPPVRSYAQGYASQLGRPPQQFQIIPGAPQWLQDQVGQQVMGWGAGGNSMQSSRNQAYDYQMANYYAKGPPYVETPAPSGGGGYGYGDWGGGGGGGGGYDNKPEWFERMLNWKY